MKLIRSRTLRKRFVTAESQKAAAKNHVSVDINEGVCYKPWEIYSTKSSISLFEGEEERLMIINANCVKPRAAEDRIMNMTANPKTIDRACSLQR
jgi:hypothetical protein